VASFPFSLIFYKVIPALASENDALDRRRESSAVARQRSFFTSDLSQPARVCPPVSFDHVRLMNSERLFSSNDVPSRGRPNVTSSISMSPSATLLYLCTPPCTCVDAAHTHTHASPTRLLFSRIEFTGATWRKRFSLRDGRTWVICRDRARIGKVKKTHYGFRCRRTKPRTFRRCTLIISKQRSTACVRGACNLETLFASQRA